MKKLTDLTYLCMFVIISGACAKVPLPSSAGMINPGDKIGDFLITKDDGEDVIFVTKLHCPFDSSTETESCEEPIGAKVNVSQGIFADPSTGKTLDELWSEMTYEMIVEGQPVNLKAFGFLDFPIRWLAKYAFGTWWLSPTNLARSQRFQKEKLEGTRSTTPQS